MATRKGVETGCRSIPLACEGLQAFVIASRPRCTTGSAPDPTFGVSHRKSAESSSGSTSGDSWTGFGRSLSRSVEAAALV
jgi:hypothetical protein